MVKIWQACGFARYTSRSSIALVPVRHSRQQQVTWNEALRGEKWQCSCIPNNGSALLLAVSGGHYFARAGGDSAALVYRRCPNARHICAVLTDGLADATRTPRHALHDGGAVGRRQETGRSLGTETLNKTIRPSWWPPPGSSFSRELKMDGNRRRGARRCNPTRQWDKGKLDDSVTALQATSYTVLYAYI